ncbi:hypothetical protein CALCODRAFT_497558 [Calocera cornea HHB12733]|uniref:Methyltransferase domain-containing protein n=1 Tax=Calocera cornea HHB12733 TaxID=1353952 RepID=A0A165F5Y2_9BASI|nr:hypothetical protein CALCODRAFT_497558 [Calocera cornea HHB12733]
MSVLTQLKHIVRRIQSSQPALASYSPRALSAFALLALLLILFIGHTILRGPAGWWGHGGGFGAHGSLDRPLGVEDRMIEAEGLYNEMVRERIKFVNDLGGPGAVDPWPRGSGWRAEYTLWDFFLPSFECPRQTTRIGKMGDGGKWVCGMELLARKPEVVLYSFGVSTDSSFEAAVLDKAPGAQVWGYDYSVNSFGPQIVNSPVLQPRAHFHKWAIGGKDAHGPEYDPDFQVYTIETLMLLNGHKFIDILKVDIEGSEFDVLAGICTHYLSAGRPLPFGQLQVEIHAWDSKQTFADFLAWWELLERAGLRAFRTEPNLVYVNLIGAKPNLAEYSFINVRGHHDVISSR